MALHVTQVEDLLANVSSGVVTLPEAKHNRVDASLEPEVQTDKESVKIVGCRQCGRPLVVTTFFAPAKAICRVCKGDSPEASVASVGVPIPGSTDPRKAVNLADCLINPQFAHAACPVHPDDETHIMELKSVHHNDHYGPGEGFVDAKGRYTYRQTAQGETVMHQCTKCRATVTYSTTAVVQFKRMNEAKPGKHVNGWTAILGERNGNS